MTYTYTQKECLGNKLTKITNKIHMEKIIKIIKQNKNHNCLTENISQGNTYIRVNYLSNITCHKIDKYLNTIINNNNNKSETISTSFSHYSEINNMTDNIKLSIKEKSLITRDNFAKKK